MKKLHNASDIKITYNAEKYKKIDETIGKYLEETMDFQLLLSLYGFNRNRRIDLDVDDNNGKHEFSRTVYQKRDFEMHSRFGFITILANQDKPYSTTVNRLAFEKMDDNNQSFSKLENVRTFYEYLLGGIEPLYDALFEIGYTSSVVDLASTLFSLVNNDLYDYERIVLELNEEPEPEEE